MAFLNTSAGASLMGSWLFAVANGNESVSPFTLLWQHLMAVTVFSFVGVVVFVICLILMEKFAPFSIVKEIGDEHNVALAVIIGAIVVGISIIIGASILG